MDIKIPPFMGAITFKDYNEEFLSEAQNSVSLYSLNQKVDDGSVTLQNSSSVPLFSAAFFLRTFACNVVMKVIINVNFEAVFVS